MRHWLFKLLILSVFASRALAWNSAFVQPSGPNWTRPVVNVSGVNFQIPDFSYSGYKLSEKGLGDGIPCNSLSITAITNEDITPKLNQAVTTLAAIGGGTIYIPAGNYQIGSRVTILADNIVIKGAGSALTQLSIPATYPTVPTLYEGAFYFTGNISNIAQWILQSRCLTSTAASANIAQGAMSVQAANAAIFSVGDWVVLQQFFWNAFNTAASTGTWPLQPFASQADREYSFTYVRKVAAVAGNVLTLDAPIPRALALTDNSITIYKPNPIDYSENLGIEGLSIDTAPRPTADLSPIYWKGVYNGWARDIKLTNFGLHGFQPQWSARVTILDCATDTAQYIGGGGQGYSYHVNASQEILVRRCSSVNVRHNMTTQKALCSDVVFSRVDTGTATQQNDTHHSYAHNVLWDKVYMHGGVGLSATNRGNTSSNAYETFAGGAVWNSQGDGVTTGGWQAGRIQIRPDNFFPGNQGFVIGNWGGHRVYDNSTDINSSYVVGTEMLGAALQVGPRGNVAYEGINTAGLQPDSLFEAQLISRAGSLPPDVAPSVCGGTPSPTPSSTVTASPTLTRTQSPTATRTPSPSMTRTESPSSTATLTLTPSPTISMTHTSSPTAAGSFTDTPTPSPSQSPTGTFTTTPSVTLSPTGSVTPSLSQTQTGTLTLTPPLGLTFTPTISPSPTLSLTVTVTRTVTPTFTLSATLTPVLAPSGTSTPPASAISSGPGELLSTLPSMNPQSGPMIALSAELSGSADGFEVKIFSKAHAICASQKISGNFGKGWNSLWVSAPELSSGIYYYEISVLQGFASPGSRKIGKLALIK